MANEWQQLQNPDGAAVKMWTHGVPVDPKAQQQLLNTAKMPFIFKHLAVMPDVHVGKGSTIGSVIPTKGAIIPAAVGVDIGCGMIAVRTSLTAADLPDNLLGIRSQLEQQDRPPLPDSERRDATMLDRLLHDTVMAQM